MATRKQGTLAIERQLKREQRALDFAARARAGQTQKDIAAVYGLNPITVCHELSWADRAGLLQLAEDYLLQNVVPQAMREVERAVQDGNSRVAVQILQGSGVLKSVRHVINENTGTGKKDLRAFLRELREKDAIDVTPEPAGLLGRDSEPGDGGNADS